MSKLQSFDDGKSLVFQCPGCECWHHYTVPRWSFNGDFDKPTFSPSLLYPRRDGGQKQCHLFVKNGRIEYLSDCDHELAGKTIDMVEMEGA